MKLLVLFFLLMPSVWADQVCLEKGTQKLLEYQSAGRPGTCTANLVAAGRPAETIVEKQVTASEWAVIRERELETPTREAQARQAQARQQKAEAVRAKLGLSAGEFNDLRESLR